MVIYKKLSIFSAEFPYAYTNQLLFGIIRANVIHGSCQNMIMRIDVFGIHNQNLEIIKRKISRQFRIFNDAGVIAVSLYAY